MDEHGCLGVGNDVGGGGAASDAAAVLVVVVDDDAEASDTALGSNMGDEMVDPPLLTIRISAQFQNLLTV